MTELEREKRARRKLEGENARLKARLDNAHQAIRHLYDAFQRDLASCLPPDVPTAVKAEFKTALAAG